MLRFIEIPSHYSNAEAIILNAEAIILIVVLVFEMRGVLSEPHSHTDDQPYQKVKTTVQRHLQTVPV
ncbi:hypothetical protein CDAR_398461 [Caerostris darwini]|uniref:Uncharacterized protein n=1 Tax=Caerostris darwini TaxID=1538125 RepID=A0AAV4VEG6_9ARAC|nr:hypothetical protein CDAR_398461 [Caerostris darwini]